MIKITPKQNMLYIHYSPCDKFVDDTTKFLKHMKKILNVTNVVQYTKYETSILIQKYIQTQLSFPLEHSMSTNHRYN